MLVSTIFSFSQMFPTLSWTEIIILATFNLLPVKPFNLDQANIFSVFDRQTIHSFNNFQENHSGQRTLAAGGFASLEMATAVYLQCKPGIKRWPLS